ncbi:MAG TPA: hypothetical protein PKG60_14915 [Spirochaetota bacterium]|nr:hypothetical protein [Spirochaetota bacterium]HPS87667.1 hypothetical protein [Spirochaetota bacterium]
MSKEKNFNTLDEFMNALKKLNITKVAFSEVKERRAEQTKVDLLEVVVVKKVDILSYKDSVIYKFSDKGEQLEALFETLVENGFDVKRISKNIT